MQRLSFLVTILILTVKICGAQYATNPLEFRSSAIKMCVAKDESISLATRAGEVGLLASLNSEWRRVDIPGDFGSGPLLDNTNFFNKDTGFVSGFVGSPPGNIHDILYRTTNGGATWAPVKFKQDGWIDAASNLDNGEAWLSVAGSGFAYTKDYGVTWNKLKNPEIRQRFASIFFNTKREGLIGSLWNLLALTNNNCETWTFIPTPLDQKKYSKTNLDSRPEINDVAIYNDYLFVQQEEMVFYTKRDSIDWVWLPNYTSFYTDPENTALYFKSGAEKYILTNSKLEELTRTTITDRSFSVKCKNGNLYVLSAHQLGKFTKTGEFSTLNFSAEKTNRDKENIGFNKDGIYEFQKGGLYQIAFKMGTSGCFHNYQSELRYTYSNGEFGHAVETPLNGKSSYNMPESEDAIDERTVINFLDKLPDLFDPGKPARVEDFEFTDRDYNKCKQDILNFQKTFQTKKNTKDHAFRFSRNNINFDRLLSLVDSIKLLTPREFTFALSNVNELTSTTVYWKNMEIINKDGDVLLIASRYFEKDAFFLPFTISLNGKEVVTMNMEPYKFLMNVYPEFINKINKVSLLHAIVKKLY